MPVDARTVLVLGAALIDEDGNQWIEVIPTAEKARNGRFFFTITRADLDAYAASIAAQPDLIEVDYDHDGVEGGSTAAAGWFTGETMVVEPGETNPAGVEQDHASLWARVKWTPQGRDDVETGRYKRISPVFNFHDRDAKTGLLTRAKEIVNATLTNRPFFREMVPVGAAGDLVWDSTRGFAHLQEQVMAQLNPGDSYRYWVMDVQPGMALVREAASARAFVVPFEISASGELAVAPASDWVEARQEWVQAAEAALESVNRALGRTTKEAEMDVKVLAKSLGLPEDATEEQITAALAKRDEELAAAKAELEEAKQGAGDDDEVAKLRAELDAERKARIGEQRDAILAKAVEDRLIDPAAKEILTAQFGDNLDGLKAVLATYTPMPKGERGSGGAGAGAGGDDDREVEAARDEFSYENRTVDDESLQLHVKAEKILRERGKHDYTDEEYQAAVAEAERELGLVYRETPAVK